jgi:hypothetical protein
MIQIKIQSHLCRTACIGYTRLWISYTASTLIGADLVGKIIIGPQLIGAIVAHPDASCAWRYGKADATIGYFTTGLRDKHRGWKRSLRNHKQGKKGEKKTTHTI